MMSTDQRKPGEKSGKRKQKKAKKAELKDSPEQVAAKSEPIDEVMLATDSVEADEAVTPAEAQEVAASVAPVAEAAVVPAPAEPVERVASFRERMAAVMPPADTAPAEPPDIVQAVPSPATAPVAGIQAIANAYRDYTKQSLDDVQSFAEKLTAARSLDKAVEAQTEFARQACETFVDNSRKIRELQREMFWQAFRLPTWGRTQR